MLGRPDENCKALIFVLHGYGQLASEFLKRFESVSSAEICIVAPEGLSRFYLKGLNGDVGASWMTKEGREDEIEDYINYLNHLCEHLLKNCPLSVQVHIIGFSQGAATASRWVDNGKMVPASLSLWSGAFAHDLSISFHDRLNNTKVYTVCGLQDKIYPPSMMKAQVETLSNKGFDPEEIYFEGKHGVTDGPLQELLQNIGLTTEPINEGLHL